MQTGSRFHFEAAWNQRLVGSPARYARHEVRLSIVCPIAATIWPTPGESVCSQQRNADGAKPEAAAEPGPVPFGYSGAALRAQCERKSDGG
jgi:hypothetical protein